jgi:hypothetical protein
MWILIFLSIGTVVSVPSTVTSFTGLATEADCVALREAFVKQAGSHLSDKLRGVCISLPTPKGPTQ